MNQKITPEVRIGWYVENLKSGEIPLESFYDSIDNLFRTGDFENIESALELVEAINIYRSNQ